jgi:hypothetical protein
LFSIFWSFSIPISLRHVLNAKERHIGQSKQTEKDMRSCDWTVPPPSFPDDIFAPTGGSI